MRAVGKPLLDHQGEMPLPVVNSLFDALYPPGLQWYWRADFVKELSDEAIAEHARHGAALPTMHSTMHLYAIDGAAHRVGMHDTAFSYRDANWAEVIVGVDPDPANSGKITKWCKDYFDALHPYSAGGAYVNFMMDEGQERVQVVVPRQLRAPGPREEQVRPDEPVPRESEHTACGSDGVTAQGSGGSCSKFLVRGGRRIQNAIIIKCARKFWRHLEPRNWNRNPWNSWNPGGAG